MELYDILPLLMFAALAVLLFTGLPVAFVLAGVAVGFAGIGIALGEFALVQFYNVVPRIWGGIAENLILTAVPMFILMGTLMERSGLAEDLLRCLDALLARVPGGLALAVVAMGTVLAATTGIIGASVVMMTLLALPAMLRARYDPALASGVVAASGTLGILIPPSIMLVVMAELLAKPVGKLFFAALTPGLVLAGLYAAYVVATALLRPGRAPRPARDETPGGATRLALLALVGLVPAAALIALVLGSILLGWASPTEAAGVGAAGALVLAAFQRPATAALLGGPSYAEGLRAFPGILRQSVERTALTGAMLFAIFIGATAFSLVFRSLGGDDAVTRAIEGAGLGPWGVLALLMALVFALGFFFDWIEITLIVLPVFAPVVEALDFGPHVARADVLVWFAVLMAINLQTSFLTPPFGFALFYLKGAAPPEVETRAIWRGAAPFIVLQLLALALVAAWPEVALWLPRAWLN
jgi:tripartite ATP-independent transporter DctM subunit